MKNIEKYITQLTQLSLDFFDGVEPVAMYLFGSAADDSVDNPNDLDIAILMSEDVAYSKLELTLHLSANINDFESVDVVNLNEAETAIQYEIVSKAKRFYCTDDDAADYFEQRVWEDFLTYIDDIQSILDDFNKTGRLYGLGTS